MHIPYGYHAVLPFGGSLADNTPMWIVKGKPPSEKGKGYDRGHRIADVTCHCGKFCDTRIGYYQHLQAKHPKRLRQMKKSGEWEQIEFDWPYDRKR